MTTAAATQTKRRKTKNPPETFKLEPEKPGNVPARVIEELRQCYREAKDYAGALSEAVKAQAEKHKIKPGALRRYIAALEGDKLDEAAAEAADLERLIEGSDA